MSVVLSFVDHFLPYMFDCLTFTCTQYRIHSGSALYRKPHPHFLVTGTRPYSCSTCTVQRVTDHVLLPYIVSAYKVVFLFPVLATFA